MSVSERVPASRLIAAGIQTFLYGWVTVAALAILTFTLKADSPALGEATWQDAARIATGWWMTAFGGTLHFAAVQITLPPLAITLITFAVALSFVRRLPLADWRDVAILCASGAVTVGALGSLAPSGSNMWRAVLGAALLLLLAAMVSRNRTDWFGQGFFTTPAGRALYDGLRLALRATAIVLICALLTAALGLLLGWSQIRMIAGFYVIDILAWILLWGFQLCYLPTMVLWALAYIVGAGFSLGAGTSFSATNVASAPLPAVPLLGALPQPHVSVPWVIPLIVIIIFAAGWRKAMAFPTLSEAGATGGLQVAFVFVIFALLGALASGSIGPERMQVLGPEPPRLALAGALVVGLPMLAGLLAGNRVTKVKAKEVYANYKNKDAGKKEPTDWVDDAPSAPTQAGASSDGLSGSEQRASGTPAEARGSAEARGPAEDPSAPQSASRSALSALSADEPAPPALDADPETPDEGEGGPRTGGFFAALHAKLGRGEAPRDEKTDWTDREEDRGGESDGLASEAWDDEPEEDGDGILLEDDTEASYQRVVLDDDWDRDLPSAPTAPMDDEETS